MSAILPEPPQAPQITSMRPSASGLSCLPTVTSQRPDGLVGREFAPVPEGPGGGPRKRHRLIAVLVVAIVAAGARLLTRAPAQPEVVSGRAGPRISSSGMPERWEQREVTITLDGSLDKLSPEAREAVEHAFGAWISSSAKLPRVTFDSRPRAPVLLEPDGENRVYFAPITLHGHENDLAITLGYSNPETGELLEADVIVNSRHPFALLDPGAKHHASPGPSAAPSSRSALVPGCTSKYDLESVVTHEAGHFWGLGEDTTDTTATMFYSTPPCNIGKRVLEATDAHEVSALYAAPPVEASSEPLAAGVKSCTVGSIGQGGSRTDAELTAMALGLVALRRRRRRASAA